MYTSVKEGYWHRKLDFDLWDKILDHFYKEHDNRDWVIAEKLGIPETWVGGFLHEHLEWKMRRINERINNRYESDELIGGFQEPEDVRLSNMAQSESGE